MVDKQLAARTPQVARFGLASASNHWLFTTFVNLTILLALLLLRLRGRIGDVDRSELFQEFAPAVRLELVILYFFALLHKLNGDFLDPAVSCATDQYAKIALLYPLLPEGYWVEYAAISGTLMVEALIPILLCIRRTRLAGLLLGASFHFGLALNPDAVFFDFSSMLFAAFFLFLPYDYWGALRALPARSAVGRRVRARVSAHRASFIFQRFAITLGVALVTAYLLRLVPDDRRVINVIQECVRLFWSSSSSSSRGQIRSSWRFAVSTA